MYRRLQHLMFLLSLSVIGAAFYFQYISGLQPCPLCMMQRFCAFLFILCCLMGLRLSTRQGNRILVAFQVFFAASGLFFATRQLWLQSLPAGDVPACLPGFDVLIHYFPWHDVLIALFWGTGECAEVVWSLLGLSMPAWAAFYFLILFAVSGLVFIRLMPSLDRFESTKR